MYGDIRSCVSSVEEVKVKTQLELRKQGRLEEMIIEDEQASFQDGFDESRRLGSRDIIQRDGRNATMILIVSLGNIVPRIKGMEELQVRQLGL